MLTLGIDPGTATTGYGLITEKNGKLIFVDHGVILTSPKESSQERLRKIYLTLRTLISDYKPHNLAIERIFHSVNTKTAIAVSQARGMALLSAAEFKVAVAEYTPTEVKLAVTGHGGADKRQVQQMVKALLGLTEIPRPDDAADALAIAICHQNSHKIRSL